jgi:uncharacterized protein (TIGR02285 family)
MAKEVVAWSLFDSPPSIIIDGEYKGQGNVDLLINFYQSQLLTYSHENLVMNFKRFFKYVDSKSRTVCAIGAGKNPKRMKVLYYSHPTTIELGKSLVIRKEAVGKFKKENQSKVSIEHILAKTNLTGILVAGRSYAPAVNKIIEKHVSNNRIQIKSIKEKQLIKRLMRSRIDFFLHTPSVVNYLAKEQGQENDILTLPISEAPSYTLGYTVCNKTDTGKRVIQNINSLLQQKRSSPEYLSILEKWQNENSLKQIQTIYREDFIFRLD